jgi:hypothetical protein
MEEYIQLLRENIVYQLRHKGYARSVEIAKFATMVTTGRGQDDEVLRYRRFEDDDLKKQRLRLFNAPTKYAISRPRKYWKKVGRVEGIRRDYESPQQDRLNSLMEQYENFVDGMTLEDWLIKTLEYLGVTDPNAWIVYERDDLREQGQIVSTKIYPFVFAAADSLNFEHDNTGRLSWFIGRTIVVENIVQDGVVRKNDLENYYLYAPGTVVRAREKGQKTIIEDGEEEVVLMSLPPNSKSGAVKRTFLFSQYDNGTTEIPARQAGVYRDEVSGLRNIFVPWFDPAEHVISDLIRDKTLNDTLSVVYAYPRRWEFEPECRFSDDEGECVGGHINGNHEHKCPSCKGTGVSSSHNSEQMAIKLVMPTDPEAQKELLDLSKLSFTEQVDTALIKMLDERIEAAEGKIMAAVFDSGLYQKPVGSETRTATEVDSVMDGISDVLAPFCHNISYHYELSYRVGAQYLEFPLMSVRHNFPEDLNILTLSNEVAIFQEMKESGVGYEAVSGQRGRVMQKVYEGSHDEQAFTQAKYLHEPFAGKSDTEKILIVSARSPLDPERVLWENFDTIFRDIKVEFESFADLTYQRQREIVAQKVEQRKTTIVLAGNEPMNDPDA